MEIIARSLRLSILTATVSVLACGCLGDYNFTTDDIKENGSVSPESYDISSYESFDTEVGELSSLCFNHNKDGFYAVGDEGDVLEIGFDGKTKRVLSEPDGHDWEGVECYADDILLVDESKSTVYRMSGGRISLVAEINVPGGGVDNNGPEGIMCVKDTLYIGNQANPTRIVKYCITSGVTCGWFDIKVVSKYISDLCYDSSDNTMWIIDSKGPAIFHCSLAGSLIATYNIPFVTQAEALVIDRDASVAWVGCDKKSKLYKIPIEI